MDKHLKIYNEFINFLRDETVGEFTEYEKKLINLIIDNFDSIADVGTAKGKRGELLNTLIIDKGKEVSPELSYTPDSLEKIAFPFEYISSIEIENFRGFSDKEKIDFNKKYTFIYGPNGSGKSSLCEALEYSLLGYINEANLKRIPIDEYKKNSTTNDFSEPIIKGVVNDTQTKIRPNSSLYHFCFIEKNRIDDFARISANTPSEKGDLLSILFGLNEFNEFVKDFTENFDNYIDIEGVKNIELEDKKASVKVHEDNINKGKDSLDDIEKNKDELSTESKLNKSFHRLDLYIHGRGKTKGRLDEIDQVLSKPTIIKCDVPSADNCRHNISEIRKKLISYKNSLVEFNKKKDAFNFRELYKLTLVLQPLSKNKCPVCETPVKNTVKHPYENAKIKLEDLKYIAELEQELEKSKTELSENLDIFRKNLEKRIEQSDKFELEKPLKEIPHKESDYKGKIDTYAELMINIFTDHDSEHNTLEYLIDSHNNKADEQNAQKDKLIKEKEILVSLSEKIKHIKTIENEKLENIEKWQSIVDQFKSENIKLIEEAQKEKDQIVENKKYVSAYNSFLYKLNTYKENLPLKHVSRLSELTKDIYNQINIHDKEYEKLSNIRLPSKIDDTIELYFNNDPGKPQNALQLLSEGHIRCLGLAILLAKNIQEKCPFIVFDDMVNAIDDDHRGGVRELLFNYDYLKTKQIILTSHGANFIKELEQHLPIIEYNKLVKKISLLQDEMQRKIRVKFDDCSNFILIAQRYYKEAKNDDALYNCRRALENITNRIWNRLGKQNHKTEFKVAIRTPKSVPDLMTVVESLNRFIKNNIDGGKEITDIFDYLLGLEANNNIIWQYLNKGTHEETDKPEFDQLIVLEVINKLTALDNLVKRKKTAE